MPLVISPRAADINGLPVRRVLPTRQRRTVGPFCFLDEMGPATFAAGDGIDVRPHPHIGLSTLTYLLDGELVHRDSLGCTQAIRPGDVNWMTAGGGVTHSERSSDASRASDETLHGVQAWIALEPVDEDVEPSFQHVPEGELPVVERDGVSLRVLAGAAFGAASPVRVHSPLFYVEARWSAGGAVDVSPDLGERAFYPLAGSVTVDDETFEPGALVVLDDDAPSTLTADGGARVLLLGGPRRTAPIHMHWNYVASDTARIDDAKARWARGDFPRVIDDDGEPEVDPRG